MKRLAWVRREPTTQEAVGTGLLALATAAAAGAVAWYVTRTWLSRDTISLWPEDGTEIGRTAVAHLLPGDEPNSQTHPDGASAGDALG